MKGLADYPARLGRITLDEDETLDIMAMDALIQRIASDPAGLHAIELIVTPQQMTAHEEILRLRRFVISGSESREAKTWMKLRRNLQHPAFQDTPRSIYPTGELALSAPVLQPTKEERAAHSNLSTALDRHYSDSAIEQRLAAIAAEASTSTVNKGRDEHRAIETRATKLSQAIARKRDSAEG